MAHLPGVGDRFGRYRIDAQIGRGGMGVVFGATDLSFNRTVALKVVSATLGDSEDFRLRFEREASLLARLDSPHVIEIFDYGVEDGCPYIATQYVGGGDLGGLIQARGAMPPALAARVCAQVADALHDAHRAGVVHRDVKPTNVLLRDADTTDLHAYLCDFGIARTANDGLTAPGLVAGTWSYLAPECGRGAPGTPASDVYALGCLLWATLTGAPPFRGSDVEVAIAHQNAPVPQLVGDDAFTRQANLVLSRSLAKEPSERYSDADLMRQDLLAVAGLPTTGIQPVYAPTPATGFTPLPSAAPAGPGGSTPHHSFGSLPPAAAPFGAPPKRRRTTALVAMACVSVLVIAGGAFGLTRVLGGDEPGPGADPTETTASGVERLDEGGPITADLDQDGLGDLYAEIRRTVMRQGETTRRVVFTSWSSTGKAFEEVDSGRFPGDVDDFRLRVAGDFDQDELLDQLLVTLTGAEDPIQIDGELSGGTVIDQEVPQPDGPSTSDVYVGDVDGNGGDDLVVVTYDEDKPPFQFSTLLFDGEVFADPQLALEVPYAYTDADAEFGDFDGDGLLDALMNVRVVDDELNVQSRLEIYRGDGEVFGPDVAASTLYDSEYGAELLVADLDGDEDAEAVVTAGADTFVTLRVLDSIDGAITDPEAWGVLQVESGQFFDTGIGVTDVNGDGLDDIVGIGPTAERDVAFLEVAVSDGETFASGARFGTWDRDLVGRYGPDPLGNTFP